MMIIVIPMKNDQCVEDWKHGFGNNGHEIRG